ncbi:MAG: protein kinase domain-containing protein [Bacillota bacterium]
MDELISMLKDIKNIDFKLVGLIGGGLGGLTVLANLLDHMEKITNLLITFKENIIKAINFIKAKLFGKEKEAKYKEDKTEFLLKEYFFESYKDRYNKFKNFNSEMFYLSDPIAQWYGIMNDLDLKRRIYLKLKKHVINNLGTRNYSFLLAFLYGASGSGKSTLMRRLAYDLVYNEQIINEYKLWWVDGKELEKFIDNRLQNLKSNDDQNHLVFIESWPMNLSEKHKKEIVGRRKTKKAKNIQYVIIANKSIKKEFTRYKQGDNFYNLDKCNDNREVVNYIINNFESNSSLIERKDLWLSSIENIKKMNLFALVFITMRRLENINKGLKNIDGDVKKEFSSIINDDLNNLEKNNNLNPLVEVTKYYAWLNKRYNINLTKKSFLDLAEKCGLNPEERKIIDKSRLKYTQWEELSYYLSFSINESETLIKFHHNCLVNEIVKHKGYDENNIESIEIYKLLNYMMTNLSEDKSSSQILYKVLTAEENNLINMEQKREWFYNLFNNKNQDYQYLLLIFEKDYIRFASQDEDQQIRINLLFEAVEFIDRDSPFWSYAFDFLRRIYTREKFLQQLKKLVLEYSIDNYYFAEELFNSSLSKQNKIKLAVKVINYSDHPKIINQAFEILINSDLNNKNQQFLLTKAQNFVNNYEQNRINSEIICQSMDFLVNHNQKGFVLKKAKGFLNKVLEQNLSSAIVLKSYEILAKHSKNKEFVLNKAQMHLSESQNPKLLFKCICILKDNSSYLNQKKLIKRLEIIITQFENEKLIALTISVLNKLDELSPKIIKRMKELIGKAQNQELIYQLLNVLYFNIDSENKTELANQAKNYLSDAFMPKLIQLSLDIVSDSTTTSVKITEILRMLHPDTSQGEKMPQEVIIKALNLLQKTANYRQLEIDQLKKDLTKNNISESDFLLLLFSNLKKNEKIIKAKHVIKTSEDQRVINKALSILEDSNNNEDKKLAEKYKERYNNIRTYNEFFSQVNMYLDKSLTAKYDIYNNFTLPKGAQGGTVKIETLVIGPTGIFIISPECFLKNNTPHNNLVDKSKYNHLYFQLSSLQKYLEERTNISLNNELIKGLFITSEQEKTQPANEKKSSIFVVRLNDIKAYFKSQNEKLSTKQIDQICKNIDKIVTGNNINLDYKYKDLLLQKKLWAVNNGDYSTEAWLARKRENIERELQIYIYNLETSLSAKNENKAIRHIEKNVRALERLDHPAMPKVIEHGRDSENKLYTKIDPPNAVINGYPLRDYLQRFKDEGSLLPIYRIVSIFQQLIEALEYAHDREVYHRALKPSNIFVNPVNNYDLKLGISDFSSARIQGEIKRTTSLKYSFKQDVYTPPELKPGVYTTDLSTADFVKMDIYCVGVLLLKCLTLLDLNNYDNLGDIDPLNESNHFNQNLYEYFWHEHFFSLKKMIAKDAGKRYSDFSQLKSTLKEIEEDFIK